MDDRDLAHPEPPTRRRPRDVIARASRRRRFRRIMLAVLLGLAVWGFTLGALGQRVLAEDQNDLLPVPLEALLLGAAFVVGSLPVGWSIVGRVLLPVPTFFLYLTVFLGKDPPLPYYAAFILSGVYAAGLTTLSRYLADRPGRAMLGSRRLGASELASEGS
jgi:hypothetical protein